MKFFRDFGMLVGGQAAAKFIGLLAFAHLARVLDPGFYGSVEFVAGLAGLVAMVVDLGLSTIGVRRAAAAPEERSQLAAQISLIRFVVALVCVIAMMVVVDRTDASPTLRGLVMLYGLSLLLGAWYQEWLLQSARLMTQVALAQIIRTAVFFAGVLLLVRGTDDAQFVGGCEIAAVAAAVGYALYVQRRKIGPIRLWGGIQTAALIREALPVALGNIIWSAAQYAPLFLMGAMVGGAGTGYFAGANRLAASIATFSFVYHLNLFATASRLAQESAAALVALMRSSFRVMAWVTIGGALAVSLAAVPMVTIIFGPDFRSAAPSLAILIWTVPVMFLSGHARWSLILARSEFDVFRSQVIGFVAVTLLGVALVPAYSATGAAAAALGGNLGVWLSSYALARIRRVETPPLLLAAKPLLLAAALAICTRLTPLPAGAESLGAVLLYALGALLVDRRLTGDLGSLARAGAGADGRSA